MNAELLLLQAELDPDPSKAIDLLAQALNLADEQGAVATALRAAALIILRAGGETVPLHDAQTTLDLLDGRLPMPQQRDWMQQRLDQLRPSVRERSPATVRA